MSKSLSMQLTPREWGLVESLYPDAAEFGSSERTHFLDRHCVREPGVRAELEAMLKATEDGVPFMTQPVSISAPGGLTQGLAEGAAIGPWKILSLIGRGGMGEVYLAERADGVYAMRAAVKVLKRGLDTTAIVERFLRERRILARLSHPNIARVLDAGSSADDRPYLVMELVEGTPITEYCHKRSLPVRQIAGLMRTVAEAVAEAHRQNIVHRDLKPSNVLVTEQGQIKLLDFGIAKLLAEDDGATRGAADLLPLTPAYAAPEQILGQPVTMAVDVYAMGTMLYLLLTGRLPHLREGLLLAVLAMSLRDEVTARPSITVLAAEGLTGITERKRIARELSGELDWIVLKALHPEPARRYLSAVDLADDLSNYLELRPVRARPDSTAYRIGRFIRRYPVPVTTTVVALVALITGLGAALWQARVAGEEAQRAKAISDFVTQDLLASVNPNQRSTANITLKEMLQIAAGQVDKRFVGQPLVAAELHYALGKSYSGLGMQQEKHDQYEKAAALFEKVLGRDSERTLDVLEQQAYAKVWIGDYAGYFAILQELIQRRTQALGANSLKTLRIRYHAKWLMYEFGDWPAHAELQAIVEAMARNQVPLDDLRMFQISLIGGLRDAAEYEQAERLCRLMLLKLKEIPASKQLTTLMLDHFLARILMLRGRYQEAEQILSQLRTNLPRQVPAGHAEHRFLEQTWAELRLEQGRVEESIASAQALLQRAVATEGIAENISFNPLIILAGAYMKTGQHQEALAALRKIEAAPDKWFGEDHPLRVSVRTMRADALRGAGHADEAWETLNSISPIALSRLPARHPYEAERLRVQGLLWLQAGKHSEARKALAKTSQIFEYRLGPDHWRSQRARQELALAS